MRMRRTSLAASLLSLTLSAAAPAQDLAVNRFSQPSLFTQPDSVAAEDSSLLNGSCPDGWNQDWQWRFQADALYLKRNRQWQDIPVITGPESFRPSNLDFDYKAGTRLSLGIMQDDFEMDFVFTTLNDWKASQSGVLTNAVDLWPGRVRRGTCRAGRRQRAGSSEFPHLQHVLRTDQHRCDDRCGSERTRIPEARSQVLAGLQFQLSRL